MPELFRCVAVTLYKRVMFDNEITSSSRIQDRLFHLNKKEQIMQLKRTSFDDSGNLTYLSDELSGMRTPDYKTLEALEKATSTNDNLVSYDEFDQLDIYNHYDVGHSGISSEGLTCEQICEAIDNYRFFYAIRS